MIEGVRLYQTFEVEFQLDGHFWLQYGQYLVEAGDMRGALTMMERSIDAYPDNEFAWHALADIQLKVALSAEDYDAETRKLIGDAVEILNDQDKSPSMYRDYYAIVTLATGHVGALIKHGQTAAAEEAARKYLARIGDIRRQDASEELQYANDKLLRYLATGEWIAGGASQVTRRHSRKERGRR
jgi:tetratricopeptide (TPR) repeat protein